ncbi:MarR family transcriptional regulator OS=Sphingobium scionense OX=1404341 GN=GGQ90_005230 PE=4 SV=1 [Sphingobium scionense]
MGRARRSFKLRLSPAGLDVLINSHCHLIRITRSLIAWGTTLHVAVEYLNGMPTDEIIDQLRDQELGFLAGREEHHVGASCQLWDVATGITERVQEESPETRQPTLGNIYILALLQITKAERGALLRAFDRVLLSGARTPASRDPNDLAG